MGGYSGTSDLNLGREVGLGGYSGTSDLNFGIEVGNLAGWGGYSGTSDLDEKVGNLEMGGYSVWVQYRCYIFFF